MSTPAPMQRRAVTAVLTIVFFSLFCAAGSPACAQATAQLAIIANPGLKATALSESALREIFTGVSTSLPGGIHVIPVLLRDGPIHEEMLTIYIGKSDFALVAGWRSLVFSGEGVMPPFLTSEHAVIEFVARTPGAIGYIGRGTPHEGVKVLVIR